MPGLSCGMQALSLRCVGSVVAALRLSCPAACGILVPRPRIKPTSPALEGRFFSTGPPGKSLGLGFVFFTFKLQMESHTEHQYRTEKRWSCFNLV